MQLQAIPPNSDPSKGEPMGLIICETVDPSANLDFQGYIDLSSFKTFN